MWQPSWACPTDGYFYPPTLFTDVQPSSTIAQVEIFGPVLVAMTFRTPRSRSRWRTTRRTGSRRASGPRASTSRSTSRRRSRRAWSGSTRRTCSTRPRGFGGYRESGFGREGGREGMWEYVKPERGTRRRGDGNAESARAAASRIRRIGHLGRGRPVASDADARSGVPPIDRTPKLFIGGKQTRPDSGLRRAAFTAPTAARRRGRRGKPQGHSQRRRGGARGVDGMGARPPATLRGQILYYIAENLAARADEFARAHRRA